MSDSIENVYDDRSVLEVQAWQTYVRRERNPQMVGKNDRVPLHRN